MPPDQGEFIDRLFQVEEPDQDKEDFKVLSIQIHSVKPQVMLNRVYKSNAGTNFNSNDWVIYS